jgi:hypothetical protein
LCETVNSKLIIYIGNRTNISGGGSETTGLPTDLHLVFSRWSVFLALLWNAIKNTCQIMYVLGRHQYVRCNPSINVAPAHSMDNLNTLALDRVPFIQRKSVNSKGLLHLYFQILIKTWKPFRWHTPAEVFPSTDTRQRGVCIKNP